MDTTTKDFITVILLAGGAGTRMGGNLPKQFRLLKGKPLCLYSYEFFFKHPDVNEIIVVCDPRYRSFFPTTTQFALPGLRRQDSVYNGLISASKNADIICIHDSARPFIEKGPFNELLKEAHRIGAAALAIPTTNTIKEADAEHCVCRTLPRHNLWEIQTPQAIRPSLLFKAYAYAQTHQLEVTDDLSLIEAIHEPAVLVPSSPSNLKITSSFDWIVAEGLCESN